MTAKEFMSRAYRIKTRIKRKKEQLAELRALSAHSTAGYGSEQVSHSRNTSSLEDNVIRIIEHEEDLERDIAELCRIEREVEDVLNLIADDKLKLLLRSRYINGLSWNEVGADCGVCERQAQRLEIPALKMVETVLRTKEASKHA